MPKQYAVKVYREHGDKDLHILQIDTTAGWTIRFTF